MKNKIYRVARRVLADQKGNTFTFLTRASFAASFMVLVLLSGCADVMKHVTKIDRESYQPVCANMWKGKTIFIDFDTSRSWYNDYASHLSSDIRDQLIEDVVEDGCFHVQDRYTGRRYAYKIQVRIAKPVIHGEHRVIRHISATFRIKIYDRRDNLITAKTRRVVYDAPPFVLSVNNSQAELLENYAYNVSIKIRKAVYEGLTY